MPPALGCRPCAANGGTTRWVLPQAEAARAVSSGTGGRGWPLPVESVIRSKEGSMMRTDLAKIMLLPAMLCVLASPPAHAEIRILASPGGQVGPFLDLFERVRASGERVI